MKARIAIAVLASALLAGFQPRGSQTLGYLSEHATLIAIGTVKAPAAAPGLPGAVREVALERTLKGKPPGARLVVWLPDGDGASLAPGQRALFFLSDRAAPLLKQKGNAGIWRIEGEDGGVADPALAPAVSEILTALGSGDASATMRVLVEQAGDARERVREDAAADLERRCPRGCAIDAPGRARLRALASKAPAGSPYRGSLLRAAGDAKPEGGRAP